MTYVSNFNYSVESEVCSTTKNFIAIHEVSRTKYCFLNAFCSYIIYVNQNI